MQHNNKNSLNYCNHLNRIHKEILVRNIKKRIHLITRNYITIRNRNMCNMCNNNVCMLCIWNTTHLERRSEIILVTVAGTNRRTEHRRPQHIDPIIVLKLDFCVVSVSVGMLTDYMITMRTMIITCVVSIS